jgi:hypothetical protein
MNLTGRFPERSHLGLRNRLTERSQFPLVKRSQRPFYQTNPMALSGEWVEKVGEIAPESTSQTNPLTRYDVLSSEKCRCSGRDGFPERSQRPFYQTNPMAISEGWVEKAGDGRRESASPNEPIDPL